MGLSGSRIVVLGGSSGLGLAVAKAASLDGATVVVVSKQQHRIDKALSQLPSTATAEAVDLADGAAVSAFFAKLGSFNHLVYTAGEALALGPLAELDWSATHTFFDIRYWGALWACKHAAAHIRPGGSITLTSGTIHKRPTAGSALASRVTAAMEGLTRALAVELAPIRVNIVSPGLVKTPLWDVMSPEQREAFYQSSASSLLLRHVAEARDVAESYLHLMQQTYATGQVLSVDGGYLLG